MLRSCKEIIGYTLNAYDGPIGAVHDFYFDDHDWQVRYFVVDTRKWLPGRRVLISPVSFGKPDWSKQSVPVMLTRENVKSSPDFDSDKPVSRQYEAELRSHYSWPGYATAAPEVVPAPVTLPDHRDTETSRHEEQDERHLRSLRELQGYRVHAYDGDIGGVEDFIAEDTLWDIVLVTVDTRHWLPGPVIAVSPERVLGIRWAEKAVYIDLSRKQASQTPEFDPNRPVNAQREVRWYDFHGRPVDRK